MDRKTEKLMREYPTFNPEFLPAADLKDRLELLDDFCSMEVFRRGRTGHHITTEPSARHPKGRKVAHFDNAADADFVCALINSWHAGRLQVVPMEIRIEGETS
ncbi:MAG: hypothetical protein GQ535_12395 [Rhodobacteraceae bacterium]|nr:hypothetical protein [Paracoccaceae bacterium]